MAVPRLTLNQLRAILRSFDVSEKKARGKGGHTYFYKDFPDGRVGYPVPQHGKDVANPYVRGARKAFHLTKDDGVTDDDFFGRK